MSQYDILQGDCRDVLKTLPDDSVHCVVTSPPYFGLRRYLFDKAAILRHDLTEEELDYVRKELERLNIKPRL